MLANLENMKPWDVRKLTFKQLHMYLDNIAELERRAGYPVALSISAMMADRKNGYGGKRPPKPRPPGEDEDPPLTPGETFHPLEIMAIAMPEFLPPWYLAAKGSESGQPEAGSVVVLDEDGGSAGAYKPLEIDPITAEGVIRAVEMGYFPPEFFSEFLSRIYMRLLATAPIRSADTVAPKTRARNLPT